MLRKLIGIATVAACIVAAPTAGWTFSLGGYTGEIKIVFSNFDAGTTGYPTTSPAPGSVCTTVATCDTAASSPAPGAIGSEDTWGIAAISVFEKSAGGNAWVTGQDGEAIQAMFYGLTDHRVTYLGKDIVSGNNVWQAFATGGFIDLYLDAAPDDLDASGGPGARVDLDTYPTATDGSLFLRLQFTCCVELGDTESVFKSNFSDGTIAGAAQGFVDVVGGAFASLFDTNSISDPNGNLHDFTFDVTFTADDTWTVRSTGQALGAVATVPGPAPLLLVGLSLGLFALRARRRA
jgi:hypothetical protein